MNPAQKLLELAYIQAHYDQSAYITLEHLLEQLLEDSIILKMLGDVDADIDRVRSRLRTFCSNSDLIERTSDHPRETYMLEEILKQAQVQALAAGRMYVSPIDVFASILLDPDSHAVHFLEEAGGGPEVIYGAMKSKKKEPANEEKSAMKLSDFTVNLNKRAMGSPMVSGRDTEIQELIETANRKTKPNALLVGPPGVGKTAIAEGLAQKIVRGEVPEEFDNKEIRVLDLGLLVAGTKYRGEFEERMSFVLKEASQRPIILFIDEFHTVIGAGAASSSMDVANLLKPALSRGDIQVIAATTDEEYRSHLKKDKALMRRFLTIDVREPSEAQTLEILKSIKEDYEDFHDVRLNQTILKACIQDSRFIRNRYLPDRAIDVLDAACARAYVSGQRKLTVHDIREQIAKISGISVECIHSERETLKTLEKNIKKKVYGQDEHIQVITDQIITSKLGVRERNKPLMSCLLQGPTGTGKTETVKQIANDLNMNLLHLDMSEYTAETSKSRLIGADPNYTGYNDGHAGSGLLINELEKNPNTVILFDEIEKANALVINVLLQIMDEGKLTSGSGQEVSFENAIVFMTSNLGAKAKELQNSKQAIGFNAIDSEDPIEQECNDFFPPEFRGRLDVVQRFNDLNRDTREKILQKFIKDVNKSLKSHKVSVTLTEETKQKLINTLKQGGARALKKEINEQISKPISKRILFEDLTGKVEV